MKNIESKISDVDFISACNNAKSMASACSVLGLPFSTFKRKAMKLGCYNTNQSGKGLKKKPNQSKISLIEILDGKQPQYQTNKLRIRLLAEGIKQHCCEICHSTHWMGKPINVELHHMDGDRFNHRLENLQIVCPNCHSFTDTYCGKNMSALRETREAEYRKFGETPIEI